MAGKRQRADCPGTRPDHPDRRLQSLNDFYEFGFLEGLLPGSVPNKLWRYNSKRATGDQYHRGFRDGRALQHRATLEVVEAGE